MSDDTPYTTRDELAFVRRCLVGDAGKLTRYLGAIEKRWHWGSIDPEAVFRAVLDGLGRDWEGYQREVRERARAGERFGWVLTRLGDVPPAMTRPLDKRWVEAWRRDRGVETLEEVRADLERVRRRRT